ncbi:MAG TPA: antibiotic biosynthesis monooxygenase family protein [Rhizomicrobium sp.]|jgi:quinol monooxygenase YgiN|nr:antibiotic biosynthesis monooxygenase family protein [Rhizomicrobium sp.]
MTTDRRSVVLGIGVAALAASSNGAMAMATMTTAMFGMIGKMTVAEGKRDEVVAAMLESVGGMPGCLSYIIATDPADANAIWITEAWDSKESHDASLKLPEVQAVIAKARPHITGMTSTATTTPVGGFGLTQQGMQPLKG